MIPLHPDLCPYTKTSLKLFTLPPLYYNLPLILSTSISLVVPNIALYLLTQYANNHIKLVKHQPNSNHEHSPKISMGVILRSLILGVIFNIGLRFTFHGWGDEFVPLGLYLALLATFHFSEFFVTSLTNPATLSTGSFLLYHSPAYIFAILASFSEYSIEAYFFPTFKRFNFIAKFGLSLCILGELIRKLAMFTAGENFSHLIQSTKSPNHKLVTHGIYSYFRHPSYAGWFYWAMGSQILMLNPVCTMIFFLISYNFFKKRIAYEEHTLVEFFGIQYLLYKEKVGIWMPIFDLTLDDEEEDEVDKVDQIVDLREGRKLVQSKN